MEADLFRLLSPAFIKNQTSGAFNIMSDFNKMSGKETNETKEAYVKPVFIFGESQ